MLCESHTSDKSGGRTFLSRGHKHVEYNSLSRSASFLACSIRVPPSRSNPTTALCSAGMISCRSCTITTGLPSTQQRKHA